MDLIPDKPPYKGVRGNGSKFLMMGKDILQILIKKYLGEKESELSKFLRIHNDRIEITPQNVLL